MFEYRHFKVVHEKGVTVAHLVDPRLFDTLIVTELEDELLDMLDKQKPQKLLVDFDGVTHCSTAAECAAAGTDVLIVAAWWD